MWIEKLKSGKYRAVERYTEIMTGKQKKVSVTMDKNTTATRKAAESALISKIMELNGPARDTASLRLCDLVEHWRTYQKTHVKASTYKRNYHAANTLMRILGKDTLVCKLSAAYINDMMEATGKGPGTINEHIVRLKSLLRWGYKKDYVVDISYLAKLETRKNEEKKEKLMNKYMESDELKKLIDGMEVERWKDLTKFLALTGLRLGEAFALELYDIDLDERLIRVYKTFDPAHDIVTSTKTGTSTRNVFMQDEIIPLCRKLRAECAAKKIAGGNGKIFLGHKNEFYAYEKYFRENTAKILGRKLTPHALRHTHVALLAEQGVYLDVISRRLGHKNSQITRDVYFHVTKKLQAKDNEAIRSVCVF